MFTHGIEGVSILDFAIAPQENEDLGIVLRLRRVPPLSEVISERESL